jgi:hypothetical protein
MDIQSVNPATGELLETFSSTTAEDLAKALALARTTQKEWEQAPREERAMLFHRLAGLMKERSEANAGGSGPSAGVWQADNRCKFVISDPATGSGCGP